MHRNNIVNVIITIFILFITSCIKTYEPEIVSNDAVKFVVSGQVSQGDSIQIINVSTTSKIRMPIYIPVSGCKVAIIDSKGMSYNATDMLDGNYEVIIPKNELTPGASFKLEIQAPNGDKIVSDFDQIQECPDVDSVYYIQKTVSTNVAGINIQGIQFYINLEAEETTCRNFRWEVYETWEYHSEYPIEWFYDGLVHHVEPPDFSRMVCWKTALVNNIYVLTTKYFTQNKYRHFPLHFVDNYSSSRLDYGFSLLFKQYAMSEEAAAYWENIKINSEQKGGLYEKQPLAVNGNLKNLTHPDHEVLGFFETSSVKTKRIFVKPIPDMPLKYDLGCRLFELKGGIRSIPSSRYPAYLLGNMLGYQDVMLEPRCVDCLKLGGTNEKPVFWPIH